MIGAAACVDVVELRQHHERLRLHRAADEDGVVGAGERLRAAGTASAAATSDGRLSTRPIAPSSSWCAIRTTVLRKFGSTSDGDETSSLPWSDSI